MRADDRIVARLRSSKNRPDRFLAESNERAAQAELHFPIAATQLSGQRLGEILLLPFRHEDDSGAPRAPRDFVVGVAQQRPRDRGPRGGVLDLGQRVQRLTSGLRAIRAKFLEQSRHGELRRETGQRPREHVPHEEVGLDRASSDQRFDETRFRIGADGESRAQTRRSVARGKPRDEPRFDRALVLLVDRQHLYVAIGRDYESGLQPLWSERTKAIKPRIAFAASSSPLTMTLSFPCSS